jgi:hypothetical protein
MPAPMPAVVVERHADVVGQGRAADAAQVHVHGLVRGRAECTGHPRGGRELGGVALAVGDAQRVAGEALLARDGQHHRGVHAAGE